MNKDYRHFLEIEVPAFLDELKADAPRLFGIMTPHHMVEHLILTTKFSLKRYGEPEETPTERQLGFKRFIEKGAVFKYMPKDKTAADLPALKYGSLEEAINQVPGAIKRFYEHADNNPEFKCYNNIMGELNFEELEFFHYQHYRWHLYQFGLIASFA